MITSLGNNKYLYPSVKAGSLESIEAGDLSLSKFGPKLKLNAFHPDELAWASLSLNMVGTLEPVKTLDQISFSNDTLTSLWKPTGIVKGFNERGGFDWLITIAKKPDVDYLNFDFDSQKLIAYHQPELTAEEIADGAVRPEHVINSVAFYHQTKGGLVTPTDASRFITTGKAGHLYRMIATDAKGTKVWCPWTIEKGSQLRLWIDQAFLKTAVYPVVISPAGDTFGYTTAGGTVTDDPENRIRGSKFSAPADASLDSLTVYCRIYSGSVNSLKGVLCNSSKAIVTNGVGGAVSMQTSAAWVTSTFSTKPSVTSSNDFFLMYIHGNTSGSDDGIYAYDTGSTNQGLYDWSNSYASPTNPSDGSASTDKWSVYATYTAGGGAQTITLSGLSDGVSIGTLKTNFSLALSGLSDAAAIGTPQANLKLGLSGLSDTVTIGGLSVVPGGVTISPSGLSDPAAIGSLITTLSGGTQTISPEGLVDGAAFGTLMLSRNILPSSVVDTPDIGTLQLKLALALSGLLDQADTGTLKVNLKLSPSGLLDAAVIGNPQLNFSLQLAGLLDAAAFGSGTLTLGATPISLPSVVDGVSIGALWIGEGESPVVAIVYIRKGMHGLWTDSSK